MSKWHWSHIASVLQTPNGKLIVSQIMGLLKDTSGLNGNGPREGQIVRSQIVSVKYAPQVDPTRSPNGQMRRTRMEPVDRSLRSSLHIAGLSL